jgi:hypothetical protein
MTTDPSDLLKAYHLGKKINNIFQKCIIKDDNLYMNKQQENEMTVLLTLRSKIGGKVEA